MNEKMLKRVLPWTLSAAFLFAPFGVEQVEAAQAQVQAQVWDFVQGAGLWKYSGKWAYQGDAVLSYASGIGNGSLKLDVDFSKDVEEGWSEVKLANGGVSASSPLDLTGYNHVSFDFYYVPQAMHKGSFKTKLYMKMADGREVSACPDIDLKTAVKAGNGLQKVHVDVPFAATDGKVVDFELSVVGCNTDYQGSLYLDTITLGYDDGYVQRTVQPAAQQRVDMKKLSIPSTVALTDPAAIDNAARLYAYLQGMAASEYVMYGHQNDLLMKAGKADSDTYGMVKDYPAVIAMDAMTLAGNNTEYQGHTPADGAFPPVAGEAALKRAVELSEKAAKKGAIVSLSAHMPNFAQVAGKGKIQGAYDYSGFTSVVTTGNVVQRIMPGGDLNEVYCGYLDKIAAYGLALQKENIPVLFRPFHENNGSWFWWGAAHCSASEFKNLFRYTEEYLRDQKGVHNFLYVYSPNGPFADENDYLTRYPGDAFIDIPGFDMYQEHPQAKDGWMDSFAQNMDIVQAFAAQHHKVTTVPEAGILCGKDTLGRTGAQRKDWYSEVLDVMSKHKMAYFLSWSNFNADVFDEPYMVDAKRGHEMVDGFTRFYNDPRSVFAGQMGRYQELHVTKTAAASTYGYLLAPSSNARVCAPVEVKAKAVGNNQKVRFLYKNAAGQELAAADAVKGTDGLYTGEIRQADLDAMGQTVGTVELELDGQVMDSLRVFYNMPEVKAPQEQVDDFECYYGDNELLKGAYSTNCGPGCSIQPLLTNQQHSNGNAGLDFHYKLAKGGWAGIIKSMNGTDWSDYDAVQFWLLPDGKAQKLIIQINTDGEDFEVNLADVAAQTKPQLVTLPFSAFKGKNNGVFNKKHIQHFAIYCNTVGDDPVDSHFYLDDIKAVKQ